MIVTLVLLTVKAVLVDGLNVKLLALLDEYVMSSVVLSVYVTLKTNPAGAKFSPAV